MPSQRDYMIATVLGEDNLGSREGQAAIIDSIFNRQNAILSGRRAPGYFEAKSSSIQDIVTANRGNQYNTWKGTPEEAGNAARAARALQGREATSGREREQYDQIAKIYDEYMAGEGGWQGISQGATFYQTPKSAANGSFQNKYYNANGGGNYQDIGSHRFTGEEGQYFKDKNAFYQANPQLYNPNASAGFDPSSPLNPGLTTQGPGDFLGVGAGTPGGSPGLGFTGLFQTGAYDLGSSTGTIGGWDLGRGINQYGISQSPFGGGGDPNFSNTNVSMGVGNGVLGQLPAGFDGAAYLRANGDVAAAGMDPAAHYLNFGRQEGRALSPDAWAQTLGPPAGTSTFGPSGTPTIGSGSTASTIGAPQAFNASNYLAANADLQALGFSPERAAQHFQEFGQFEARALAPGQEARAYLAPGATSTFGPAGTADTIGNPFAAPTLGGGSNASTIGASATTGTLPPFFSPRDYVAANPDLAGMSDQQAIDHFQTFGRNEVRSLAPWLQASIYGAPAGTPTQGPGGLSPTYQPPQPTQTFGPGGSIDVMSSGLVPTQQPPDLTSTFGPGPTITARTGTFNPDEYLKANGDVAASGQSALDHFRNYGYREGRAIDTLGNHFNGDAYLAANRDVAMAGMNPLEHFLRWGAQEARTLAPTDWASPLTATTNAGTYGAPAATQTLGPGGMTSTYGAPDPTLTIGPPALAGTYGPPATTPTIGAGNPVPSWNPFGGAGIGNPYNFSRAISAHVATASSRSYPAASR